MSHKWKVMLRRYDLPYFHMVDCAHRSSPFDKLSRDQCAAVAKEAIDLIKQYVTQGYAFLLNPERFVREGEIPDPYSFAVDCAAMRISADLQTRMKGRVQIFIEDGNVAQAHAAKNIDASLARTDVGGGVVSSVKFAPKADVPLLQAADLLAWHSTKYLKDKIFNNRPLRKDFASLMEVPHEFCYIIVAPGKVIQTSVDLKPQTWKPDRDLYLKAMMGALPDADSVLTEFLKLKSFEIKPSK